MSGLLVLLFSMLAFSWGSVGIASVAATTDRVSVDSSGSQGNDHSKNASISANGRYVAFASDASNLVPGDTNNARDIFVHDRETGATERASVGSSGVQGNADSYDPVITNDGRFIAFVSSATNLVEGDVNGHRDIFIHDRSNGATELLSMSNGQTQANADSRYPSISASGRFVAFSSDATNLVPGDTNSSEDVFVRDREMANVERISVNNSGGEGNAPSLSPSISASTSATIPDGRFIAFASDASNLIPGDTNGQTDVFVRDTQTGRTVRASVSDSGTQANGSSEDPSVSSNGIVAFGSRATNLVSGDTNGVQDVFIRDLRRAITELVSVNSGEAQGNARSYDPEISKTQGNYVSFTSAATNLTPGDTNGVIDIFERNRFSGRTTRASVGNNLSQANAGSSHSVISPSGRYVAFFSAATNLVMDDTNAKSDVFVRTN